MRWTQWILLLCLTTTLSAMASDNVMLMSPEGFVARPTPGGSLDDPQPDSLFYDDGTPAILNTGTNYWCRVRFTPLVDFNIISVYHYIIDGAGNAPCSLFVFNSTPAPGGEDAVAVRPGPQPANGWIDVNFNDTVTVLANQDFWIVFGPVPGGGQSDGNWNSIADGGSTSGRSQLSTQGKFGTYNNFPYDWILRIGGTFANTFVDLSAGDLVNEINSGDPSFNFMPGQDVTFTQDVTNVGTGAAGPYVYEFQVTGPQGTVVYTDETVGTGLADGASDQITTSTPFTPTAEGEYVARGIFLSDEDGSAENDTSYLRFFVGGNDRWYRYDDDEDPDSYLNFSVGSGWGLKFIPAEYPAELSQIRLNVNGAATGTIKVWVHPADEIAVAPEDRSITTALAAGWNTVAVNPGLTIFEGQALTIGYLFATGAPMGFDLTPPNAAGITAMGPIAVQLNNNGTDITEDDGGNICIQAYFEVSTAVPPFPVIDTDRDTINFGAVSPAWPGVSQTLTVYNNGGVDPLNVTNITVTPNNAAPAYQISPTSFTVAAGGSREVTVTFDPPVQRTWNGILTIASNAENNPAFTVLLRGIADTNASVAREINLPVPNEFSLRQNYPNPFNPQTDIQFSLPVNADVRLTVVNMLGQEVAVLVNETMSAGVYTASFNGANLPSGLYFYRLDAGDYTSVRKMMLMK